MVNLGYYQFIVFLFSYTVLISFLNKTTRIRKIKYLFNVFYKWHSSDHLNV